MSYLYNGVNLITDKFLSFNDNPTTTNYLLNGNDLGKNYLTNNFPLVNNGDDTFTINNAIASSLGSNTADTVEATAYDSTRNILYAGGGFTQMGGVANTAYIAKWDGSTWSALGTGANYYVTALAYDSTRNILYAGGYFTQMSGVPGTTRIAKWNGSTWSALAGSGTGPNSKISSLAYDSTNNVLYAGGNFIYIGSLTVNKIAKWNASTSTWSALGQGMYDNDVLALAYDSVRNILYAGGYFTNVLGYTGIRRLAKWTVSTSTWSSPGVNLGVNIVSSLAFDSARNILYVGGIFISVANVPNTNYIAKWDGSTWSALGTGASYGVGALAYDSTNNVLYAAGTFTQMSGLSAKGIAKLYLYDNVSKLSLEKSFKFNSNGSNGYFYKKM